MEDDSHAKARIAPAEVRTLESGKSRERVLREVSRLERRIFPKHESLADNLHGELQKRNVGLLYALVDNNPEGRSFLPVEKERNPEKDTLVAAYLIYTYTSVTVSITKLAVRESCRRQGYGEALVKHAIERGRTRRAQCVNLHVDPEREPAVSLYRKLGFQVDAVVHSYYAPNRDAHRMALNLAPDS